MPVHSYLGPIFVHVCPCVGKTRGYFPRAANGRCSEEALGLDLFLCGVVRIKDALVCRTELPGYPRVKTRVLLGNCPHETESVNSQVSPCNAASSDVYPCQLCTNRPLWIAAVMVCCQQLTKLELNILTMCVCVCVCV